MKSIKDDCNPVAGTGIRIRSRQPEAHPNSMNSTAHGTAPRRMRLGRSTEPKALCSQESKGEEDESSCITEVSSVYSFGTLWNSKCSCKLVSYCTIIKFIQIADMTS